MICCGNDRAGKGGGGLDGDGDWRGRTGWGGIGKMYCGFVQQECVHAQAF